MRLKVFTALVAGAALAGSAGAQTAGNLAPRVDKLEKEMKAVQRTVFPQGVPVQPEIGGTPPPATAAGDAASTPVTDLTARVDALEKGLAAMTGQVEQNGNRLRLAEEAMKVLEARVKALEPVAAAVPAANDPPAAVRDRPAPTSTGASP
ncbi:MAG: hypothetical protein H0X36_10145, partial [Sphingomonadaceae bacterium]|nr:hypothetical protein [Sphingomonadaceae bacterium]